MTARLFLLLSGLSRKLPKAPRRSLLLIAGLVWLAAGINIFRLGAPDMASSWNDPIPPLLCALVVFLAFFLLIFRRLIAKHTMRILACEEERILFLYFFDKKSYLLMAFMMTFGILLRASRLVPPLILGTFYAGLGASLIGAGLGFLVQFYKAMRVSAPLQEESK